MSTTENPNTPTASEAPTATNPAASVAQAEPTVNTPVATTEPVTAPIVAPTLAEITAVERSLEEQLAEVKAKREALAAKQRADEEAAARAEQERIEKEAAEKARVKREANRLLVLQLPDAMGLPDHNAVISTIREIVAEQPKSEVAEPVKRLAKTANGRVIIDDVTRSQIEQAMLAPRRSFAEVKARFKNVSSPSLYAIAAKAKARLALEKKRAAMKHARDAKAAKSKPVKLRKVRAVRAAGTTHIDPKVRERIVRELHNPNHSVSALSKETSISRQTIHTIRDGLFGKGNRTPNHHRVAA